MDELLAAFLSGPTILLALGSYVVTLVARRVVETACPWVRDKRWWSDIVLPVAPILFGGWLAVQTDLPPADIVGESRTGKALFGCVAGLWGGFLYVRMKAWLRPKVES